MKSILTTFLLAILLVQRGAAADEQGAPESLTFFGWSDQHVQVDGRADHLPPAIDAMNALPGKAYPERFGGTVDEPAFVFGCGDVTEWPTNAAKNAYAELIERRLKFPAFDIIGNHDEGGKSPSDTMKRWIVARHGALSYTFERGGVHFIALYSKYDENLDNPAQPVSKDALDFLRKELAGLPQGAPVIVALHLCYDAITNRDALIDAIGEANVILVLGGHYHKSKVDRYRNVDFLQLPSPAPNGPNEVMVVRVGVDRLVAVPYDYAKRQWNDSRGKVLDVAIRRPTAREEARAGQGVGAQP